MYRSECFTIPRLQHLMRRDLCLRQPPAIGGRCTQRFATTCPLSVQLTLRTTARASVCSCGQALHGSASPRKQRLQALAPADGCPSTLNSGLKAPLSQNAQGNLAHAPLPASQQYLLSLDAGASSATRSTLSPRCHPAVCRGLPTPKSGGAVPYARGGACWDRPDPRCRQAEKAMSVSGAQLTREWNKAEESLPVCTWSAGSHETRPLSVTGGGLMEHQSPIALRQRGVSPGTTDTVLGLNDGRDERGCRVGHSTHRLLPPPHRLMQPFRDGRRCGLAAKPECGGSMRACLSMERRPARV